MRSVENKIRENEKKEHIYVAMCVFSVLTCGSKDCTCVFVSLGVNMWLCAHELVVCVERFMTLIMIIFCNEEFN